jgi:hypothetical protein
MIKELIAQANDFVTASAIRGIANRQSLDTVG